MSKAFLNMSLGFFLVKCIYEPRGDHGMEGFQLGDAYHAEYRQSSTGKRYWRVWPGDHKPSPEPFTDYYEVCSARAFNKLFSIESKVEAA